MQGSGRAPTTFAPLAAPSAELAIATGSGLHHGTVVAQPAAGSGGSSRGSARTPTPGTYSSSPTAGTARGFWRLPVVIEIDGICRDERREVAAAPRSVLCVSGGEDKVIFFCFFFFLRIRYRALWLFSPNDILSGKFFFP